MNITFLYQYFGTPKGSWSTRVYELSKRWVEAGHNVTVITAPYEKSDIKAHGFVSRQKVEGIKLIVIDAGDSNRMTTWKRVLKALQFSILASYYILKINSDILIASSGPITIGIPGLVGKWLKRVPLVFEVRDLWPDGGIEMGLIKGATIIRISKWFERLIYTNSSLIVTASSGQQHHIKNRFPEKAYLTIPNASDLDLFSHNTYEQIPEQFIAKPLFLHIGSLGYIHNCMHLVKVAYNLKEMGYEDKVNIVFIGDGKERVDIEEFIKRHKINNVYLLGLKPKTELPKWLNHATATLFTTLNNPVQDTCSPNKIFDSFAASVPIIQTTNGWIKDLVELNNCGINVKPEDPYEMAKAMIYLIEHEVERKIMCMNALRLAQTEFNRDVLAHKYLNVLLNVVNNK